MVQSTQQLMIGCNFVTFNCGCNSRVGNRCL